MMSDLIDRQAAIDELVEMLSDCFYADEEALDAVKTTLEELPPAQREQHHDEWCTDCKEYDKERHCCPRWNKVIRQALADAQPEPCEDAVSRKAVKDGFVEMCNLICPYTEKQRHVMCGSCLLGTAFDVLEATQSVTPKQRWIPVIERLPEKQTKVLVVDFGEVDTAYLNSEGRWMDFNGDKLKDVKAWMPLPKWEGESE